MELNKGEERREALRARALSQEKARAEKASFVCCVVMLVVYLFPASSSKHRHVLKAYDLI